MYDEKILPVEEMLAYKKFTDRVEILRELDAWVKNIQRMASPSTAVIAPRRMGKTVLLDRLVNTVFFKPEYRVAPFYLNIKPEKTTGFAGKVLEYVKDREDIYFSDNQGINAIFRMYGGNYSIPIVAR